MLESEVSAIMNGVEYRAKNGYTFVEYVLNTCVDHKYVKEDLENRGFKVNITNGRISIDWSQA